jgi:hypothetical protein
MRRDSESPVWKRLDPGTVGESHSPGNDLGPIQRGAPWITTECLSKTSQRYESDSLCSKPPRPSIRRCKRSRTASDLLEYVIEMPCDQGFFVIMYRRKSHKIR